jgi:predicted SprT family Zn-dependent metalloprotease
LYKYDNITPEYMSVELQARAVDLHLQEVEKNDDRVKEMEHEIECPRCADMMTLSSEFDRLGYVCQECDLLLIMK